MYASVISYVAFVLSLFVYHLSFFWFHGKAVLVDCGISCVSSLIHIYLYALDRQIGHCTHSVGNQYKKEYIAKHNFTFPRFNPEE